MDNLVFSLKATMPVFLLMVVGYILRITKIVDEPFADKINGFVFKIALPVLLFEDLATVDFRTAWNGRFVLFCFSATFLSVAAAALVSLLLKKREERGEFIQAAYRSSAGILGLAFIQNIYGSAGMAPMMIIGSVPLYNIFAVIVLSAFAPGQEKRVPDGRLIKKTVIGILRNPILIGVILGLVWSALRIPMPSILGSVVSRVGATATPLGLIAMGASFDPKKAGESGKAAVLASAIKLVGFGALFLPIAAAMGFRDQELLAILVMLCSATTVSCYVMARNMGHRGTLTASAVMLTTFFAAFTLTGWIFVLRSLGYI